MPTLSPCATPKKLCIRDRMIRKLCKEKGVTIKTLSEVCGLSTSFMFDLEKKDASPSVKTLTKIADYFGCSLDYLAGRSDKE